MRPYPICLPTRTNFLSKKSPKPIKPATAFSISMASLSSSAVYAGFSYGLPVSSAKPRRRMVAVRAEAINPDIRKNEDKVVDSVVATELTKPLTAYCRCWRSGTFPLCDGSHVKHNKATGDNVGPLLVKKE